MFKKLKAAMAIVIFAQSVKVTYRLGQGAMWRIMEL